MVRGAGMLAVLDTHGLAGKMTYADRPTVANGSWSLFAGSGEEWGDLIGEEVEMIKV